MESLSRIQWRQFTVDYSGLQLAVQEHGPSDAPVIVALHGWRDNSASFYPLAELLPEWRIMAVDFPGHGLSSMRHPQAEYYIWSYVEDLSRLLAAQCNAPVVLLGHSMGAAVANLFVALYPELVSALIMLDMVGPVVTEAKDAPEQMRKAAELRRTRKMDFRNYYPDFNAAVSARADKGLCVEAANLLAGRGVVSDDKGWYWNLDPRLSMANPLSLDEDQACAFLRRNTCRTLLIAAPGFWLERKAWFDKRCACFSQLEVHMLDGGHHQHMEAEAPQVAQFIRRFLSVD